MAHDPIVSIFLPSGGPAVAEGVLVAGRDGLSGLFSPWPKSLTEDVEFSVYVPGTEGNGEEWLEPKEVGVLERIDEQGRSLGVVTFIEDPAQPGREEAIDHATFDAIDRGPNGSRWAALKATRANDLKTLAELEGSTTPAKERKVPPGSAARPQDTHIATATDVTPGDFFCRYLLRWD